MNCNFQPSPLNQGRKYLEVPGYNNPNNISTGNINSSIVNTTNNTTITSINSSNTTHHNPNLLSIPVHNSKKKPISIIKTDSEGIKPPLNQNFVTSAKYQNNQNNLQNFQRQSYNSNTNSYQQNQLTNEESNNQFI